MNVSRNVVIIGANRGIGLELTKSYKKNGDQVLAVCRKASEELKNSGVKILENIDVKNDEILTTLSDKIEFAHIDVLIHNAGILKSDRFPDLALDDLREQFEVNSLGPLKSVLALREKLKSGSKLGLVSSRVGSIDDNSSGNNYGYRTSKTALNMIGSCLAIDLKPEGVAVALLHPGYVKTEMTQGQGFIEPDEAAQGLFDRMEELSLETTGCFVHSNGEKLPW
jgi:NAD(P)-dependent dehydrogenase (short-subunit alcohol dehydrogenase family)